MCVQFLRSGRVRFELTFHSKWFLEALGHEGLNDLLAAFPDKSAQAVCTFAYCAGPGHEPIIFQGRTDVSSFSATSCELFQQFKGQDSTSKRSDEFWWVLIPPTLSSLLTFHRMGSDIRIWGQDVSLRKHSSDLHIIDYRRYAEMNKVEKNKISHRFRALEKLKTWLQESWEFIDRDPLIELPRHCSSSNAQSTAQSSRCCSPSHPTYCS